MKHSSRQSQRGLTLIEALVASAIFAMFSLAIYRLYVTVFTLAGTIRTKTVMTEIASEQFEFVRNLPYASVGTVSGIPAGVVVPEQTVTRNGVSFTVRTTIRNIDDPADGTLGGSPGDLSPADKKMVEVAVSCSACHTETNVTYTSLVAPKNLETENGNGALIVRAINASGLPIAGASVHIQNDALSPAVDITDITNNLGVLTIVDAPPASQSYKVTVTKGGYSSEETFPIGAPANPNPLRPHLTVAANTITQSTFAVDETGAYDIRTQDAMCSPIGGIGGTLTSSALIGSSPDVPKHVLSFTTSSLGEDGLDGVEWGTYALAISGSTYDVVGTNPIAPLALPPGSSQTLTITLAPNDPQRLVIGVVDNAGLPIAGAQVEIDGPSGTLSSTSNQGSVMQTDWDGGAGQETVGDWDRFLTSSGLAISGGTLSLVPSGTSGELTSSTIDLGGESTFQQLSWAPFNQPVAAGTAPVKFQIATAATNDEETVWEYLGPDGTPATYYTATPSDIADVHNGARYVRYKVFLSTEEASVTPTLTDIALTYTAGCLPQGQVDFGGLAAGTYHVTVEKAGFQTLEKDITLSGDTYDLITLTP